MKQVIAFLKKETVLTIAWLLALASMAFVPVSKAYLDYIDWRSLGILWGLMVIMKGLQNIGFFSRIGMALLKRTGKVWQLAGCLIFLCFFSSMLITNDVALLTFVPFAILMLNKCGRRDLMIPIIVLQTIAANLGSMLTPVGNPQNLYLYGLSGMGMGEFILHMLPLTLLSGLLLAGSIAMFKGRGDALAMTEDSMKDTGDNRENEKKNPEIKSIFRGSHSAGDSKNDVMGKTGLGIYLALFAVALAVVARILPYYELVIMVLILVGLLEWKTLLQADYALLATFCGFFIFTGNMGNIPAVSSLLQSLVTGREVILGVLSSQCISNVPAALLLSGFTDNYKALLIGVNVGGLGTLIASMASLISYKLFCNDAPEQKGAYFKAFTVTNLLYLAILLAASMLL